MIPGARVAMHARSRYVIIPRPVARATTRYRARVGEEVTGRTIAHLAFAVAKARSDAVNSPARDRHASPLIEVAEISASPHGCHIAFDLLDEGDESGVLTKGGEQGIAAEEHRVLPARAHTGFERVERLSA